MSSPPGLPTPVLATIRVAPDLVVPDRAAPAEMRAVLDRIGDIDPALARIEAEAGPLAWRVAEAGFPGLLRAMVAQQISTHAAAAIWRRLCGIAGDMTPERLLALDEAAFRAAGFSRPKVLHARALATAFTQGGLSEARLAAMSDAEAIAAISAVRGFGPWSAEVYLLFAHARPDVFPAGDVALAASYARLAALPARPSPAALRSIAEAWRPYRGLAARLLFHYWRFATGRPSVDPLPAAPAGSGPAGDVETIA